MTWAEICQGGRWLPFLVTAVHDADTVSGVAFSGQPAQVGWHRPSQDFAGVTRGERNREWREVAHAGSQERRMSPRRSRPRSPSFIPRPIRSTR